MVVEVAFGSVRVAHYERRTGPLEVSNIRPPCIDKQASALLRISGRCHIAGIATMRNDELWDAFPLSIQSPYRLVRSCASWFSWFLAFPAQIAGLTSFPRSGILHDPSPSSSI
jgi:hypothetical protein